MSEERKYFDTNGVAEFLDRSPGAIRNLVLRRNIPYRKAGGRLLFLRREVEEWVDNAPGVRPEDIEREGS